MMKKLLGIIVLGLLWCNISFGENVYDFLKKDYEYSRSYNVQNVYAHNTHSTRTILITKLKVMFSKCGGVDWNKPDRVYSINQKVFPESDKHIKIQAKYPSSVKKRCMQLSGRFVTNNSNNTNSTSSGNKKLTSLNKLNLNNNKNYSIALARCSAIQVTQLSLSDPNAQKRFDDMGLFIKKNTKYIKFIVPGKSENINAENAIRYHERYVSEYQKSLNKSLIYGDRSFCSKLKKKL